MASNRKYIYDTLSTKDTLPLSTSTSVTITAASGGNEFTLSAGISDLKAGGWIWDTANDELYKVKSINGTTGIIVGTFNDDLTTGAMDYIKTQDADVVFISVAADYGADSAINGVTLKSTTSVNFSSEHLGGQVGVRFVDPIIVDGATGQVTYEYVKY
tara:strand:- start:259 stop:732 length:474 start_codon:yes stop_codon:yes gene_type:complete